MRRRVTRFAPSPTGYLHVGNARTALFNWLHARQDDGRFILRLDDTDTARSDERYVAAILEDLAWLGIDWSQRVRQSERGHLYDEAIERLRADGRLYPCYETPEELDLKRARQRQAGRPPIYDRAALALSDADRARLEAAGRRPHWRFRLTGEPVEWHDLIRGPVHFEGTALGDPVLIREDGYPLYGLTSVIDDIDLDVTTVIRGEDHVANTAAQVELFRALGAEPPAFAHHSLLVGPTGEKLSKRAGALALRQLREAGYEPLALAALLARLGSADPVEPVGDIADLVARFDIGRLGRAAAKFDPALLDDLNPKVLHALPYRAVEARLHAMHLPLGGIDNEAFWLAVRGNLERLADAAHWLAVCKGPLAPVVEEPAFLAAAADLLPEGELDAASWQAWTGAVRATTGRQGRRLFHPLRLALTAREHGPEMANLLPLVGRRRAEARLRGRTA
jgi:glutamyl-tRNA synthetase